MSSSLLQALHTMLTGEVDAIKAQTEKSTAILSDAIETLQDAFISIHHDVTLLTDAQDNHNDGAEAVDLRKTQAQLEAAIRALQFEDIVRQNLQHTEKHLEQLNVMLQMVTTSLQQLHVSSPDAEIYLREMAKLPGKLVRYHQRCALHDRNPVAQQDMDSGDVSLF